MALMLGSLNDDLVAAGAPPEKARHAAEEVARYENQLPANETRLANVEADLAFLKWTNGMIVAGVVALLLRDLLSP